VFCWCYDFFNASDFVGFSSVQQLNQEDISALGICKIYLKDTKFNTLSRGTIYLYVNC